MNDPFYTPSRIADYLVRQVSIESPKTVADFSAGDGALLKAASEAWPTSRAIALDIDAASVRRLRYRNPTWTIGKCDFLSERSRQSSVLLEQLRGNCDVVLLNPPFSCRGGSRTRVNLRDETMSCSKAMAFVLLASTYLSTAGQIVAVLPASSLTSVKDQEAWEYLDALFSRRHGATTGRGDFAGCFARCAVVTLKPRRRKRPRVQVKKLPPVRVNVSLVRGTAQLHSEAGKERTLVHSTDLQGFGVLLNGRVAARSRPSVIGPAVLIPRVGQPRIEKVAVFTKRKRVALSDCVIGLQCRSSEDAYWIKEQMVKREKEFLSLYGGTCAKYTTLARVAEFLSKIGCAAS